MDLSRWWLGLAILAACGGSPGTSIPRGEGTFGPTGGLLDSDDGLARLEIPEGALATETRVSLRARPSGALGFEGDVTWRVAFGAGGVTRPLRLTMPCGQGGCLGDERLGVRSDSGLVPVVDGTDVQRETLRARIDASGSYGVTRCAHLYCLTATVEGGELGVTWKVGIGVHVTVTPEPGEPVRADEVERRYVISGADGEDELIAVLDPAAPPAGLKAVSTPSGAVRVLWEPPVFPGVKWIVERQFCGRLDTLDERGGAGLWDDQVSPGSWYVYRVHVTDGEVGFAQLQPAAPEEGCAVLPYACEIPVPLGEDGVLTLSVEPPLTDGRYVLGLGKESEALAGFAEGVSFGPATTTGESTINVVGTPEAEGERLVWVEATRPEDGVTCRAPVWLRVIEETRRVYISVRNDVGSFEPLAVQVRSLDREWITPRGAAGNYRFNPTTRGGGYFTVAVTCAPGVSRLVTATTSEISNITIRCPGGAATLPVTVTLPEDGEPGCRRVTFGAGQPSACVTGESLTVETHTGGQSWMVTRHESAEGPPVALALGWTTVLAETPSLSLWPAYTPTMPKTARVVGASGPVSAEVLFNYGQTVVSAGRGGAEVTYSTTAAWSLSELLRVEMGSERWAGWFYTSDEVVADLSSPSPEVPFGLEGETLSAELPEAVGALVVEGNGVRALVTRGALDVGPVRLVGPDGSAPGGAATVRAYVTTRDVAALITDPDLEEWAPSGSWVRSLRLR